MRSAILAGIAAALFAAPLVLATPAAAHGRDGRGYDRHDRDYDNWDDRRDERRAYRRGYRDGVRAERWDHRRHNGYWDDGRWHYGPPRYHRDAYRYDYRGWRRGDHLPHYYRSYYRPVDWRHHRLRPPPRGYHYVYNNDREEILLVGIATGVILSVILSD